jgi:predicted nucleic acid-binding protein
MRNWNTSPLPRNSAPRNRHDLPGHRTGDSVFVDANAFIYYFAADPVFGPACDQLLRRIENQDIVGFTSAHVLSEVAHRLMTLEASQAHGWPMTAISRRLKRHPSQVKALTRRRQAIDELALVGVQTLAIGGSQVSHAADVTRQTSRGNLVC